MLAQYFHSMTDEDEAARALIDQPAIIPADGPTGNLNEQNEEIVLDSFRDLHRQGRAIITVPHNPKMGEKAQRMLRLQHGRVEVPARPRSSSPRRAISGKRLLRFG